MRGRHTESEDIEGHTTEFKLYPDSNGTSLRYDGFNFLIANLSTKRRQYIGGKQD
jgi:hypothetical protein